jgi:Taurine catabolism dioxygenase TauD, TfdA family/Tripartite tricarboxylate transporter family receptor
MAIAPWLCVAGITPASAQGYPAKPIRIIVPFAPGGANDLGTRLLAQKLAAGIGQGVVVENRGGAGGTIGLDVCAKAPPARFDRRVYADWYNSRQGDEQPGEARAYPKPIFGFRDGHFTGMFSPAYIKFAQDFPEVPRLTRAQNEALDLYGDLSEELALNMDFEPGDIQLLNNHLTYHARTRYDDFEEKDKRRLLLRLWLAVPGSRPLPRGYELLFGNTEGGVVRGGVASKEGWRDVNEWRARRAAAGK